MQIYSFYHLLNRVTCMYKYYSVVGPVPVIVFLFHVFLYSTSL